MNLKSFKTYISISFFAGLFFYIFFSGEKSLHSFLLSMSISVMYTFLMGMPNGLLNDILNKKYSWVDQTRTRTIIGVVATILLNVFLTYLCNGINFVIIQKTATWADIFSSKYTFANWFMINFALMISAFLHAKSFMDVLKRTTRKEVVEQKIIAKSANAQFESLKNQLDPHFLFNSLNVLSALIDENQEQAQKFTLSMSKIYRYVLDQKDKELVSVEDELSFAKTYAELLETRFEDSVEFQFNVPKEDYQLKVVPLSLQLLLENCIKHNFATSSKPLIMKIYTENGFLCIENNLQTRELPKDRDGIGLSNIVQRYSLLTKENVFIEKSEDYFKVKIPMLTEPQNINTMYKTSTNNEGLAYEKAAKRVKELKGFYGNLISYCIVIPFLVIINLLTSPKELWFYWPMLGWGIGLLAHAMNVFAIGKNWEDRKIKEFMEKENRN
ncbi:2TM domain-containing protein [Soonwooa sp.]|uniref:2TM domain-containing protein n=1 Tax=Soonwooa sp. TaxID=1938592 RepID=UPI002606F4D1|nr:2TM domain-containing protein [Soonwooa sp.]